MNTRYTTDAFSYLFGSILTVTKSDLYITVVITVLTVISMFKCWSFWAYTTFDPELAEIDRHNVSRYNYLLSGLISITIVVSIKLVGIILIAAFLVIPAAASHLISKSFANLTRLSIIIGILSAILGLPASYWLDLPSGATIILIQSFVFSVLFAYTKIRR